MSRLAFIVLILKSWIICAQAEASPELSELNFLQHFKEEVVPFWDSGETNIIDGYSHIPIHTVYFSNQREKPLVLILHGFKESILKFRELAFDFYRQGFSVLVVNLRGHGFSGRIAKDPHMVHVENYKAYLYDLEKILAFERFQSHRPVILFGHSLGGAIATAFALEKKSMRLKALILSSPMIGFNTHHVPVWFARPLILAAVKLGFGDSYAFGQGPRDVANWVYHPDHRGTSSRARFNQYRSDVLKHQTPMGGASFRFVLAALNISSAIQKPSRVSNLDLPILLISGGKDDVILPENHKQFCNTARNCQLFPIKEARHAPFFEKEPIRKHFDHAVSSFLKKIETRSSSNESPSTENQVHQSVSG